MSGHSPTYTGVLHMPTFCIINRPFCKSQQGDAKPL
jgi:hypothetical protein